MPSTMLLLPSVLLAYEVAGQGAGTLKTENHPKLTVQQCTKKDGCADQQRSVVIDANWRWTHSTEGPTNCFTGNTWNQQYCSDAEACTKNCVLEGADEEYTNTYGVNSKGYDLSLSFVTQGPYSKNVGSRVYLLETEEKYQLFNMKNKEISFDVDDSQLPCGLNGALYFSQMDADGGMSKYPTNKAGAKFGTGYCDAQCPHDIKFINGQANCEDWKPSSTDANSGTGKYGSCCNEFDLWEANSISTAYTAHACNVTEQTRCQGIACGDNPDHRFDGVCDKNGCDVQTYRFGKKDFYGKGSNFDVDSSQKITVVTQFITEDGTDTGALKEIRRHYKQNGKTIVTPTMSVGSGSFNSITTEFCQAEVDLFEDKTNFLEKGGLKAMDTAMEHGMVLVLSLWDDHEANMLWLDSTYPTDSDPSSPGVARGTCSKDSGKPDDVEKSAPDSKVTFSNIKFGEIGSTDAGPSPGPSPGPAPGPTPSSCPGGSLSACMDTCPSDPATFQACVKECQKRCSGPSPAPAPSPIPSGGCCSWDDAHKVCGQTTDYCKANEQQCEICNGKWILPTSVVV